MKVSGFMCATGFIQTRVVIDVFGSREESFVRRVSTTMCATLTFKYFTVARFYNSPVRFMQQQNCN